MGNIHTILLTFCHPVRALLIKYSGGRHLLCLCSLPQRIQEYQTHLDTGFENVGTEWLKWLCDAANPPEEEHQVGQAAQEMRGNVSIGQTYMGLP